ncbi:MAG: FAA hydrolase family protein, partial [Roseateles sp.]
MKLCRHGPSGQERPGLIDAQGRLRDLSAHVGDLDGSALSDAALARLAALPPDSLPLLPPDTRLGPPVAGVGKYLAIGLNYRDHAAEAGLPIPSEPIVFMKATSCLSGPNDDIVKPPHATQLDWELELAVVIGRRASHVPPAQALDHVAGYCIAHDVSERAFQFQSSQWDKG